LEGPDRAELEIKLGKRILCDAFIRIKNTARDPMSAFDQVVRHSGEIPADPKRTLFSKYFPQLTLPARTLIRDSGSFATLTSTYIGLKRRFHEADKNRNAACRDRMCIVWMF
jgi:hypothetical protein